MMFRNVCEVVNRKGICLRTVQSLSYVDLSGSIPDHPRTVFNIALQKTQIDKPKPVSLWASKFGQSKIVTFGNPDVASKARAAWERLGYTVSQVNAC